jgi:pSer/pThr/pTyr-binding forkhead associated (FHA) protein
MDMAESTGRIVVTAPTGEERAYALSGDRVAIGRDAGNDIVVPEARVSRRHASLTWDGTAWALADLDSANGTLVNGSRVERVILKPGDLVRVGDAVLRYETTQGVMALAAVRIDTAADLEATLAAATLSATISHLVAAPQLAVFAEGRTWTAPMPGESLSIGRQADNDVVLDLPRVSRRHARIERRGDAFILRDLGSTNGTFVAGRRVEEQRLRPGETIRIGGAQLVLKLPASSSDLTIVDEPPGLAQGRPPVVIVPGLMGSQLWLGQERVWPSVRRIFTDPELFMLPDGPPLEARGIVDEVVVVPNLLEQEQYSRLTAFLEESLGYRRGLDLLEFAYDWRQDVRESARRLAQTIAAWDVQPPVIVIAHSLGCLVSRYYVERLGGKEVVGRLLLLGAPHYGAPKIVSQLFKGIELLPFGFMGERLRDVVSSFPTCYQILPVYPCVFDRNGQPLDLLHDQTWVPESRRNLLHLAREFRRELGDGTSVPAVSIFGYGLETLTSIRVERDATGAFLSVEDIVDKGGDVTVPEASSVLSGSEIHPVEQAHGSLYVDQDVKMRLKLELAR